MVMRIAPTEVEWNARAYERATLENASHYLRSEGALISKELSTRH